MENNFQTQAPNPPSHEASVGQKRNLPRDVFLHLFAIVTLYWSAISFITLCWQYINYFFPDVLNYNYGFSGTIRFAIASLAIVFPLFILTSWLLNNIYAKESEVRESKIRKWLIYLTLFITSLVIVGDLIFVINTFLGGEIKARFILKALSIILVAGVIFWYYLNDVRRSAPLKSIKYVASLVSAVVVIAIIGAFFIVGSPMKARLAQFDQQRISDLQNIQWQVVNYWQRKNALPKELNDLNDSISGYAVPNDPETNAPYEYSILLPSESAESMIYFELCATFNLDSKTQPNVKMMPAYPVYDGANNQNWDHAAGHACFERTIDQQLYPPIKIK